MGAAMKKLWIQTRIGLPGLLASALLLAACGGSNGGGGGTTMLTVGGNVTGLVTGTSVELENGGQTATITANGSYSVSGAFISGTSYDVTVAQQPAGANCVVTNGSGMVGTSNIANILVTCTPNSYTISGALTGMLGGRSLMLQDNGGNSTTVSASGTFNFSSPLPSGSNYAVTIMTQPAGQNCSVTNGSGMVAAADITNVSISCSDNTYNVGITVTGVSASGLILENNGADNLTVAANGTFNFNTPVATGSGYAVSILGQPLGESCTVTNGSGTIIASNVSNVTVSCVPNRYPISGALTGLLGGRSLILQDNGGNSTTVSANGTVSFSTPVASGSNYSVTVFSQPAGQNCSVSNGSGTVAGGAVSNVGIACSDNTYNIGVAVSGVMRSGLVLQDNGGDNLAVGANGSFSFASPVASGSSYAVTLLTQPAGENCSVSSGSGTVVAANVTGIPVGCTPISYLIGGSLTGLLANNSVTLEDNGGNDTTISVNGNFSFSAPVASGSGYAVTVLNQPPGQNCSVTSGNGMVISSNISTVGVTCSDNTYNIGVTVSGLLATESLVLQDNGGDNLTITANGTVNFATPVPSGSGFAVTILSSPLGEICLITNGSGAVTSSNANVTVGCTPNNYTVSGAVSGLLSGNNVVLQDNGGDNTTVSANTGFSFPTSVPSGSAYAVTVSTQPPGQTCSVSNGGGTIAGANISNVAVGCSDNTYNIGVTVSGLSASGLVLQDNAGDNLTISANGSVNFATPVPSGSPYAVTVLINPTGQTCTVTNGSGTVTSSNVSGIPVSCVNSYPIGGSVSGLGSGSLVLQDNGGDTLTITANGSFTFATPIVAGGAYAVTIETAPNGQNCSVTNGSGTVAAANVTNIAVSCAGEWTWMGGSSSPSATAVYGTQGVPATGNGPGALYAATTWTDSGGNFWLFGGGGYSGSANGMLDALWRYSPATQQWTWMGGPTSISAAGVYGTQGLAAPSNMPGARDHATSWTDASGHFWLFGGIGFDTNDAFGNLGDLWQYDPASNQWTWVSGSNVVNYAGQYGTRGVAAPGDAPSARYQATGWIDQAGNLWLYGGGNADTLGDLWMYQPSTGLWTWVSGSQTGYTNGGNNTSYGTLGVASATNQPGVRNSSAAWVDGSGNLWMFGGSYPYSYSCGPDEGCSNTDYFNDLWTFNIASSQWTWMGGADSAYATGTYGSQGVAGAGNVPGARGEAQSWTDSQGNFWLFGGFGYTPANSGELNDLWMYNPSTQSWTWVNGANQADSSGSYGQLGIPAASNSPSARYLAASWIDPAGHLWLLGGWDFQGNILNDLWEYDP